MTTLRLDHVGIVVDDLARFRNPAATTAPRLPPRPGRVIVALAESLT